MSIRGSITIECDQKDCRAEIVIEAIQSEQLPRTVVFGYHIPPLVEMNRLVQAAGLRSGIISGATSLPERNRLQDEFRRGTLEVVFAQIIAAGTAIDLSAARHGYFLERDWVPGNNLQAANRLISMDKPDPVTFDMVTWPGSVDDRVSRIVDRREQEINQLF